MTLKELAHSAQQRLQTAANVPVKRTHVHELLAAAFDYSSWAAFRSAALLADEGVGTAPPDPAPRLIGRALQLGYEQTASVLLAEALRIFAAARQLSCVRWTEVHEALRVEPGTLQDSTLNNPDEQGDSEGQPKPPRRAGRLDQQSLLRSSLLVDGLEQAAEGGQTNYSHLLAALYRCKRPNPYLYEESLKGRALNSVEQGWVDEYLLAEPRFRKYERHLKAAALGGIRNAAVEYAAVFDSEEFFALAERLPGDVDSDRMAQIAPSPATRAAWLRTAAEDGSDSALRTLAGGGDGWAQERLAERGDIDALRDVAERSIEQGDAMQAWTWQHLALLHGVDLTVSTMRAYHDGGPHNGEFYDSDFGGAMYADGDEGLRIPPIDPAMTERARLRAAELYERARRGPAVAR